MRKCPQIFCGHALAVRSYQTGNAVSRIKGGPCFLHHAASLVIKGFGGRECLRGIELDKQVSQEWFPPGQVEEPSRGSLADTQREKLHVH
jgi:hypothetical protein